MMIQKSKYKPLQFDANLEKIIIRTFEKRSKNSSCERAVLYVVFKSDTAKKKLKTVIKYVSLKEVLKNDDLGLKLVKGARF